MEELIRVEHATKTFRSKNWRGTVSEVRAVEDVSLTIHRARHWASRGIWEWENHFRTQYFKFRDFNKRGDFL